MAAMIGKAALELDWRHHATERSEKIKVFATLFPMVSKALKSLIKEYL
jgi:C-22 sterol desaturase